MDSYFTERQLEQLLKPLNPSRIETLDKAGQSLSYLNHADVRAHLTRVFGFGRWDAEVLDTELLFDDEQEDARHPGKTRWYVSWRATVRMRVRSPNGELIATYAETAIGGNVQPQRHEAHDMALKSAVSDALKRCAINLGDQFGLGLYDKGGTGAIVRATLVPGPEVIEIRNQAGEVVGKVSDPDVTLPEPEVNSTTDNDDKLTHAIGYEGNGYE